MQQPFPALSDISTAAIVLQTEEGFCSHLGLGARYFHGGRCQTLKLNNVHDVGHELLLDICHYTRLRQMEIKESHNRIAWLESLSFISLS